MRRMSLLISIFVLLAVGLNAQPSDEGTISKTLMLLLDDPAAAAWSDEGSIPVWVSFRDKGLTGSALEAALDDWDHRLDARSRRRRAKVAQHKTDRLADVSDLSLHEPYRRAVAATGAQPRRVSRWLNAQSVDATPTQIRAIAALPFVQKVDLVRRFRHDPTPQSPAPRRFPTDPAKATTVLDYGGSLAELEQVNVPAVHEAGWMGQGVLIGMLDTGFNTVHEALDDVNVIAAWDFINDDGQVANEEGDPPNSQNHGTMTLSTVGGYNPGTLIGPAYGASYVLAKTEDVSMEEPIEEDNWVAGIEWLDTFGVDIVSSSLGYADWYVFEDLDGNTALCTIAADLAVGKGIVVITSAGNERTSSWGHILTPADGDSVITIGAVDASGVVTSFSSPGPTADGRIKPDVSARGQGNYVASPDDPSGYLSVSGTSFACPLTSGVAALVLSRVPELTPMQVRDALRETASIAAFPDNDYGWGLIDAWAAVHYFGAMISHDPLPDTEVLVGSYEVNCIITDRIPLDPATLKLHWRLVGGSWQETPLVAAIADTFTAFIPAQIDGSDVEYYFEAGDQLNVLTFLPAEAPATSFGFHVGTDLSPPTLTHSPLGDQPLATWPANVVAFASDNLGVAAITVGWTLNSAPQGDFSLTHDHDDLWSATFPIPASSLTVGDQITYTITATDGSSQANTAISGPHSFEVITELGVVLVLDDSSTKSAADEKVGLDKSPIAQQISTAITSAPDLSRWLRNAGYIVYEQSWAAFQQSDLDGIQILVVSSGSNSAPLENPDGRLWVRQWATGGGRLLLEGGELGYDVLMTPGYPDFANEALHAVDWRGDDAGSLIVSPGQELHPLLNTPHVLFLPLTFNYETYTDQDAIVPAADATLILETTLDTSAGGLLAVDDTPSPQGGQIVVMPFNLAALSDSLAARNLVENTAAWLVASEGTPTASISGMVTAFDNGDWTVPIEGAVVSLGFGLADTTAADGSWSFQDIYSGSYLLQVSAQGYADALQDVDLLEGQSLSGLEIILAHAVTEDLVWIGPIAIPDDDVAGLVTMVDATTSGWVAGVTLEIALVHEWVGDLVVDLSSPEGTVVRLHNRSSAVADSLFGTWDTTLSVDGPGRLEDFLDETTAGQWTLKVVDLAGGDVGVLESWTLHLVSAVHLTNVDGPPLRTALVGARPNPFNPRTEIAFDLARDSTPRLTVHDLRGRVVCRLLDATPLPAGRHRAVWNGRDARGQAVASGTYVMHLVADGIVATTKVVLAR